MLVISFLYDTLRAFRARAVSIPMQSHAASLDVRLATALDSEMAETRGFGWTLVSYHVTEFPELTGEDAKRAPHLLFGMVVSKGTVRKSEVQLANAYASGIPVEKRISEALALMAELAKSRGFRPVGHSITFTI